MRHPKILLLDCSTKIAKRLRKLGFNITEGSLGFQNGKQNLPNAIYETGVIIYNPSHVGESSPGRPWTRANIKDETPDFSLDRLDGFYRQGGLILTFANLISLDVSEINEAYAWTGHVPRMESTHDSEVRMHPQSAGYQLFKPLIRPDLLQKPVRLKLTSARTFPYHGEAFFSNRDADVLGVFIPVASDSRGHVAVFPEFQDNDILIEIFAQRILPTFFPDIQKNVVTEFASPDEVAATAVLEVASKKLASLEASASEASVNLETARRKKLKAIKTDETAVYMVAQFNTATQQEDMAPAFLYKMMEKLENRYGGRAKAIAVVGHAKEFKLIGTLANESFTNVRHAPDFGEKIKDLSKKELTSCFEAAKKLLHTYFNTLF